MALQDKQKINRTIVLPFTESDYDRFMNDLSFAKEKVAHHFQTHPELFPADMRHGYFFNGRTRVSKKLNLNMRKLQINNHHYQIRPSFVLPYMRGMTDDVEKGLFLLRFGVPFWALAFVFGRYAMYWYRLFISFSTYSLLGTTLRDKAHLPDHILADEHHIRIRGEKAYVTTTVGQDCILGVQAVDKADTETLKAGYKTFKEEAQALDADYQPRTVNTDGWAATQLAWRTLFLQSSLLSASSMPLSRCGTVPRRPCKTAMTKPLIRSGIFTVPQPNVRWDNASEDCAIGQGHTYPMCRWKDNLLKLCEKRKRWLAHLDFPKAFRTSATLDRLMKFMERHAIAAQMFHSDHQKTTQNIRAYALIYNFTPSCPAVVENHPTLTSPAARANHFVYHHNWLHNLLIASSIGEIGTTAIRYSQHFFNRLDCG